MIAALIGLPLAGATALLLGGRRTNAWGHFLAVALSASSFFVGLGLLIQMMGRPAEERAVSQQLFQWITVGTFQVPFGLHLDQLSIAFVMLITGVGTLIHIYSIGYMA
ncbi:MAG: NADH-quinone oxidoreductase subunit L, partial [Actinomycetes bacterium]